MQNAYVGGAWSLISGARRGLREITLVSLDKLLQLLFCLRIHMIDVEGRYLQQRLAVECFLDV